MTELGVNVDHVATVREARGIDVPDPVEAAVVAERNGADGIVAHLRLDSRHVQYRDLRLLREVVKTRLNFESATHDEMIENVLDIDPDTTTLVPESRQEVTTEGGLDVVNHRDRLNTIVPRLQKQDILVSLFVDPDEQQLDAAADVGAEAVELHTGYYAETEDRSPKRDDQIERLNDSAHHARELGLRVFAGHGLNYRNVKPVAAIEPVEELNIGHSIVSRAVMVGMGRATAQMKERIREAG